jgi:hypothetical protein
LAKHSRLFIFSDAPRVGDEEKVNNLRRYLHSIDGFKEVTILERLENSRAKNSRGGIQQILEGSGKCIFMEDDIVTAPGFLRYMNDALEFYENDSGILNVTGYSPPLDLTRYEHDYFVLSRFNGWGAGFWKKKFEAVKDITEDEYQAFITDRKATKLFVRLGGEDMLNLLESEVSGLIDAYDVKAMFHQFKTNMMTVYPRFSLVQNTGHDVSGVHCGATMKFHHARLWGKTEGFVFDRNPKVNEQIRRANFKFRSSGYRGKLINFTKKINIYRLLKKTQRLF